MRGLQSAKVGLHRPLVADGRRLVVAADGAKALLALVVDGAIALLVVVVVDGATAGKEGIKSEGLMR